MPGLVGAFLALLVASARPAPHWVWWWPPHVPKANLFGHTPSQIVSMGLDKWSDVVDDYEPNYKELVFGVDGREIVWASCERTPVNRLTRRLPPSERHAYPQLDRHLYLFAMACIDLEDALAGGGTYAIHEPHYMWGTEQAALLSTLTKPRARPKINWKRLERGLSVYRNLSRAPETMLDDSPADLKRIHSVTATRWENFIPCVRRSRGIPTYRNVTQAIS